MERKYFTVTNPFNINQFSLMDKDGKYVYLDYGIILSYNTRLEAYNFAKDINNKK